MDTKTLFGSFFKEMRKKRGITLRKFCSENNLDPDNMSKLERGIIPPPASRQKLETYALALGIEEGTEAWNNFFDYAAASTGHIPSHIMNDAELVNKLPLVFRTPRGEKISPEKLAELAELIRST